MGWLSLSLPPSQKLIGQLREALEVVVPCPLPVKQEILSAVSCDSGKFQINTDLKGFDARNFSFGAELEEINFLFPLKLGVTTRQRIQVFPSQVETVAIGTTAVVLQSASLIKIEDLILYWSKVDHDAFRLEERAVALFSESTLKMRHVEFLFSSVRLRELTYEDPPAFGCISRVVDFTTFKVSIKRFSFSSSIPDQPAGLFTPPIPRNTGVRVPRLPKAPAPPPPDEDQSLEDRLREILFPPIEELLSDPQLALPESPHQYQLFGIQWLHDRNSALLADEMGLGKTMQAIIAARLLWRKGSIKRILIVCRKALISNWQKELRKWWPGIECFTKSVPLSNRRWFLLDATKDVVVKIINYEAVAKELDWMKEKPPFHDLIIIDEAQRIKSAKSKNSRAVKTLESAKRWALTGTPIENSQNDLVSIFGFIKPGLIRESDDQVVISQRKNPYFLRRKQEDVLKDLPAMIDQDIEVELVGGQREKYDRLEVEGVYELNQKGEEVTVTHVFSLISKLMQICNFDPSTGESAKAELIAEELDEITENKRKALIFGMLVQEPSGLKSLAKKLTAFAPLEYHGGIPANQRDNVIRMFEKDDERNVLLLNYAVGGVGLNLQAANYVFLFDRWWNPAVEDQAVKRAHRLGQKLPVFVKRLYCKDTIEERIIKKLAEKRRIFAHIIDEIDENRPAEAMGLSEEELFGLFKGLKVRPARAGGASSGAQHIMENMDPTDFETLVADVYEKEGYTVLCTGKSHDGGIDVVAEKDSGGGRDRVLIQCKRQKENVGVPIVRDLMGALDHDRRATRCDLVTSSDFTSEAKEFAKGKRVTLVNGNDLKQRARKAGLNLA